MPAYQQKITFGEMRESGVHDVLIYCRDHTCSHHIEVSADRWPDHVRPSDIDPGFVSLRQARRGCPAEIFTGQHGHRLNGVVQAVL